MRFGIGVDIEDVSRFEEIRTNHHFLKKVFTQNEISYCNSKGNPFPHFAVRFAGKEAVRKAFFHLNKNVFFQEIEILNNENGTPYINILKDGFNDRFDIKISLSHSKENALAFAMAVEL